MARVESDILIIGKKRKREIHYRGLSLCIVNNVGLEWNMEKFCKGKNTCTYNSNNK